MTSVEQFIRLVEAADMPAHDKAIVYGETWRTLTEGAHDYGVDIYGEVAALDDGDSDTGDYADDSDSGDTMDMDDGDTSDSDETMDDGADGDELTEHAPMTVIHDHHGLGMHAHAGGDVSVEHDSGSPECDRMMSEYTTMLDGVRHAQGSTMQAQGPTARPGVNYAPGTHGRTFAEGRAQQLNEGNDPMRRLSERALSRLERESEETYQRLLAGE